MQPGICMPSAFRTNSFTQQLLSNAILLWPANGNAGPVGIGRKGSPYIDALGSHACGQLGLRPACIKEDEVAMRVRMSKVELLKNSDPFSPFCRSDSPSLSDMRRISKSR